MSLGHVFGNFECGIQYSRVGDKIFQNVHSQRGQEWLPVTPKALSNLGNFGSRGYSGVFNNGTGSEITKDIYRQGWQDLPGNRGDQEL